MWTLRYHVGLRTACRNRFSPSTMWLWASNSSPEAWQQVSLATEPTHWPGRCGYYLPSSSTSRPVPLYLCTVPVTLTTTVTKLVEVIHGRDPGTVGWMCFLAVVVPVLGRCVKHLDLLSTRCEFPAGVQLSFSVPWLCWLTKRSADCLRVIQYGLVLIPWALKLGRVLAA